MLHGYILRSIMRKAFNSYRWYMQRSGKAISFSDDRDAVLFFCHCLEDTGYSGHRVAFVMDVAAQDRSVGEELCSDADRFRVLGPKYVIMAPDNFPANAIENDHTADSFMSSQCKLSCIFIILMIFPKKVSGTGDGRTLHFRDNVCHTVCACFKAD